MTPSHTFIARGPGDGEALFLYWQMVQKNNVTLNVKILVKDVLSVLYVDVDGPVFTWSTFRSPGRFPDST